MKRLKPQEIERMTRLEYLEQAGAPIWYRRRFYPHVFERDEPSRPALLENRQIDSGSLPEAPLKRRKRKPQIQPPMPKPERQNPTVSEYGAFVVSQARFLEKATRAHKLAGMDSVKYLEAMKKGAK